MKYRVSPQAKEIATNFLSREDRLYATYLKNWKKYSIVPLALHPRLSIDIANELATGGINSVEDLLNLTPRALARRASLRDSSLHYLTSYLVQLELLSCGDQWKLNALLDSTCSTNTQLIAQSQFLELADLEGAPTLKWTSSEQRLFCSIFFGRVSTHILAREFKISEPELKAKYGSLFHQLGGCKLISKLREVLHEQPYKVIDRNNLKSLAPEFQISLFPEFKSYDIIDFLIRLESAYDHDNYLDWTSGRLTQELQKYFESKLLSWDDFHAFHSTGKIHPDIVRTFLLDSQFKLTEHFLCQGSMSSVDILYRFLELQGRPKSRAEILMKIGAILDRNLDRLIAESGQSIISITKDLIALSDWGFDAFPGAKAVIFDYLRQNGATHLEMLYAILDGFGYKKNQIKSIASQPPFFVQDEVCYLME